MNKHAKGWKFYASQKKKSKRLKAFKINWPIIGRRQSLAVPRSF